MPMPRCSVDVSHSSNELHYPEYFPAPAGSPRDLHTRKAEEQEYRQSPRILAPSDATGNCSTHLQAERLDQRTRMCRSARCPAPERPQAGCPLCASTSTLRSKATMRTPRLFPESGSGLATAFHLPTEYSKEVFSI